MENLAIAPGSPAEAPGRDSGGAVEGAHEVRDVAEADVERDVRDRSSVAGQEACRAAEPAADQILVRSHAEDAGEDSQEVKRAQPGRARHRLEIDDLVRVSIDPQRRVADGARRCRLVWIADLLPNELAGDIRAMIDQAAAVMKKTLDGR